MEIIINEVQITSKDLSEITGKRHADIMRDIRKEIDDLGDLAGSIFALSGYKDISGKENPMYIFGKGQVWILGKIKEWI